MNTTIIEVAIASDSNYLVPATVLLKSLFDNNRRAQLSINLLHLSSQTKEKDLIFWEQYTHEHGHLFRAIPVSDESISVYPELRHSKSTYLRLLLSDMLPESVTKILYLDADTVVLADLLDLYQTDISDYYAAAVKATLNVYAKHDAFSQNHLKGLNIGERSAYFGAGVMLLNIEKFRLEKITAQYFKFAIEHPEMIRWSDQDIVNAVLHERIKYLPPKYNFDFYVEPDVVAQLWTKEELREVYTKFTPPILCCKSAGCKDLTAPAIIHYIGPIKPWHYLSYHFKAKEWWKYLNRTPFAKSYKPLNKTITKLPKKLSVKISKELDRRITLRTKQRIGKLIPLPLKRILKKGMGKAA